MKTIISFLLIALISLCGMEANANPKTKKRRTAKTARTSQPTFTYKLEDVENWVHRFKSSLPIEIKDFGYVIGIDFSKTTRDLTYTCQVTNDNLVGWMQDENYRKYYENLSLAYLSNILRHKDYGEIISQLITNFIVKYCDKRGNAISTKKYSFQEIIDYAKYDKGGVMRGLSQKGVNQNEINLELYKKMIESEQVAYSNEAFSCRMQGRTVFWEVNIPKKNFSLDEEMWNTYKHYMLMCIAKGYEQVKSISKIDYIAVDKRLKIQHVLRVMSDKDVLNSFTFSSEELKNYDNEADFKYVVASLKNEAKTNAAPNIKYGIVDENLFCMNIICSVEQTLWLKYMEPEQDDELRLNLTNVIYNSYRYGVDALARHNYKFKISYYDDEGKELIKQFEITGEEIKNNTIVTQPPMLEMERVKNPTDSTK